MNRTPTKATLLAILCDCTYKAFRLRSLYARCCLLPQRGWTTLSTAPDEDDLT